MGELAHIDKYALRSTLDLAKQENKRLKKLLRRANMALLCYTQSHGTPHTQLMDEIAEALGLDADGNTLRELIDD